jgi:hypothetical protein
LVEYTEFLHSGLAKYDGGGAANGNESAAVRWIVPGFLAKWHGGLENGSGIFGAMPPAKCLGLPVKSAFSGPSTLKF